MNYFEYMASYLARLNGGNSGGTSQNEGIVKIFDMMYKDGPSVEVEGIVFHKICDEVPSVSLVNFIAELAAGEDATIYYLTDFTSNDNMLMVMKDGAPFMWCLTDGGEFTPDMFGFPGYGTYLAAEYTNRPIVYLSYHPDDIPQSGK